MARLTKAQIAAAAYHEAGHAFMAWHLGLPVYRVTTIATQDASGLTVHSNPLRGINVELGLDQPRARIRAENAIMVSLAGPAAQRRHRPSSWRHAHGESDYQRASDLALRIWGTPEQATLYLRLLGNAVKGKITFFWPLVDALAVGLIEKRSLDRGHVLAILRDLGPMMRARSIPSPSPRLSAGRADC
jgi:hypothetical protein